jgi:hypothetical protein
LSNMRKVLVLAVAALCLGTVVSVGAQQQEKPLYPIGYINFEYTNVAAGIGVSWGKGWLAFEGKNYPIKVEGLGIAAVGISKVNAVGNVYNLEKPADIVGTYGAVGGGIAIAGGVKGVLAKNGKGVVIDLVASQKGVSINIGGGGFTITME